MKRSFGRIIIIGLSTLALSSCAMFKVEYPFYDTYGIVHEYTLNIDKTTIAVGETLKLKPMIDGHEVPFNLSWKTGDDLVCTVSKDGTVKGVGGGTAAVTVTFKKDVVAHCIVTVEGPRKIPKQTTLIKLFTNHGVKQKHYFQEMFLYNSYTFNKEEDKNGMHYDYELLYFDEHSAETPFKIEVRATDENRKYISEYRFGAGRFFDESVYSYVSVYSVGDQTPKISTFIMINGTYYKKVDSTHIALADGKTLPQGNAKPENDATDEEKERAFYLINDGIEYFYEVAKQYKSSAKLF